MGINNKQEDNDIVIKDATPDINVDEEKNTTGMESGGNPEKLENNLGTTDVVQVNPDETGDRSKGDGGLDEGERTAAPPVKSKSKIEEVEVKPNVELKPEKKKGKGKSKKNKKNDNKGAEEKSPEELMTTEIPDVPESIPKQEEIPATPKIKGNKIAGKTKKVKPELVIESEEAKSDVPDPEPKSKDKKGKKAKAAADGEEKKTEIDEKSPKKKGKQKEKKMTHDKETQDSLKQPSAVEILKPSQSMLSKSKVDVTSRTDTTIQSTIFSEQISKQDVENLDIMVKKSSVRFKRKSPKLKRSAEAFTKSDISLDDDYSISSGTASEIEIKEFAGKSKKRKDKKGKKKGKGKKDKDQDTFEGEERKEGEEEKKEKQDKKKKGKKPKKEDLKIVEPPSSQEDFLAEIMRLKAAALGQVEEVTPSDQKSEKKHSKKRKEKKARLTAEMAEKLKAEQEQEAIRMAELEKIRLEEEKKALIEKEKREIVEQQIRLEQLEKSEKAVCVIIEYNEGIVQKEKEQLEWQLYVDCGKLPNPSLCDQMNTYIHLWEQNIDSTSIEGASKRTADVIKLLDEIDDLIDTTHPSSDETSQKIENLRWIRQLFRDHQKESLDIATYRLLRCVEKNLHRIDISTADYDFVDEYIKFCIWLRVQLPIPLPNPRRPPKPRLEVSFEKVNVQILFPITIDCENMAIRVMYLKYDHLSDLSETYNLPDVPNELDIDLMDMVKKEWRVKMKYKYDHRDKHDKSIVERPAENTDGEHKEETDKKNSPLVYEEIGSDEDIPTVPFKKIQPTASEYAVAVEEKAYIILRQRFQIYVPDHVLNLRKYSILGGVYHLDLLYQPPQPQDFVTIDMNITALYLPKKLEHVPFSVIYEPPQPPEPGVRRLPEEIEEEMKKQEEELDKLMLITVTWPQHVIFLELPIVCQWDGEEKQWSKKHVHDLKHNEEKGILTFRTGIFGVFGLATLRYANLPYQAWDLKPELDGTITLQITAAILILEFNIKGGLICISQLQNSPNNALQDMVGVYLKLFKLKRIMKESGIDVFPEIDAFAYIEGCNGKHWPMTKHLCFDMARMCNTFNFAWSRWNMTSGRRKIVMQMREYYPNEKKHRNHSMLLITPLKATFVNCTEVSQVFCDEDIDPFKFSSDLYSLMKNTSGIAVRKKVQNISKEIVHALYNLLASTRILCFS